MEVGFLQSEEVWTRCFFSPPLLRPILTNMGTYVSGADKGTVLPFAVVSRLMTISVTQTPCGIQSRECQ